MRTHTNVLSRKTTNSKRSAAKRTICLQALKELDANGPPDATEKYAWVIR